MNEGFMYCFGYTFPFRIFCDLSVGDWDPIELQVDNSDVVIYPPFISDSIARRSCPSFDHGKSPALVRRGLSSSRRDLGLIVIPTFEYDDHGKTSAQAIWGDDTELKNLKVLPCSAVQIDVDTKIERLANETAKLCYTTWLRNIRRLTNQYWIGHFPSYFEGNLRVQFNVDDSYSLVDEPETHAVITTPNRNVLPLTKDIWSMSLQHKDSDLLPNSLDYLLDGIHLSASGDKFRSIISLAICIERSKHSIWNNLRSRGIVGSNKHRKVINDTSKPYNYLNEELDKTIGRNFSREQKEIAGTIEAIWIVRGIAAHGREAEIPIRLKWLLEPNKLTRAADELFKLIEFENSILSADKLGG